MPRCNEDPGGSEGAHVFEELAGVQGCPFQDVWLHGLTIVYISPDAIVHVGPERSNEGATVAEGESFRGELAHLHTKGDHSIVVHLWVDKTE